MDEQIDLSLGSGAGSGAGLMPVALYLSPLFASILGIQTTLRLRGEVTSGRAEAILSRPVARSRWLLAYAITGALAALAVLIAFGLGLGIAQIDTDPGSFGVLAVAGALRSPAAWVFIALTTLLLATIPRAAAAIAFIVLGAFQALEFTVEFRLVPPEALYTSPFALIPQLPDGEPHTWQTILLILIAAALAAVATRSIRHQDIH